MSREGPLLLSWGARNNDPYERDRDGNFRADVECAANSLPAEMRQTGIEGVWNGTRQEANANHFHRWN